MTNWYFVSKALHLIGMASWMAGLFYLVRIMVYHAMAENRPESERGVLLAQFGEMEWKAYRVIIVPAVFITWTFGSILLFLQPAWLMQGWMQAKLVFLILLTGYTWYCKGCIVRLQSGQNSRSHVFYRALNEVPTVIMVAIIFLAVFKAGINGLYLASGLLLFSLLIFSAVRKLNRKTGK